MGQSTLNSTYSKLALATVCAVSMGLQNRQMSKTIAC